MKREILPAIKEWMVARQHPFTLCTEASLNLADDEQLLRMMVEAGFNSVFVGIESAHEASLAECGKANNRNRDMIISVRKIQKAGMEVQCGFIVGFESDPPSIFDRLSQFIQESGIATAMVGILNAPRGTRLYERLLKEGRLLHGMSGDNTDSSLNFRPAMDRATLIGGYGRILQNIYTPKYYYARVKQFLKHFEPGHHTKLRLRKDLIGALLKSFLILGVIGKERLQYWKLLFWSLARRPRLFPNAIGLAIYGFHFRRVFQQHLVDAK